MENKTSDQTHSVLSFIVGILFLLGVGLLAAHVIADWAKAWHRDTGKVIVRDVTGTVIIAGRDITIRVKEPE